MAGCELADRLAPPAEVVACAPVAAEPSIGSLPWATWRPRKPAIEAKSAALASITGRIVAFLRRPLGLLGLFVVLEFISIFFLFRWGRVVCAGRSVVVAALVFVLVFVFVFVFVFFLAAAAAAAVAAGLRLHRRWLGGRVGRGGADGHCG